jgi:hypothetical protein
MKQNIVEIEIIKLKPHPECEGIYNKGDPDELLAKVKRDKTLLALPVVDQQYRIINGEVTVEVCQKLGMEVISVLMITVLPGEAATFRVKCHQYRNRTYTELYQEAKILDLYYKKHQGARKDLVSAISHESNETTRKKKASDIGLSESTVFRVEKLADYNLLKYADEGEIPVSQLLKATNADNDTILENSVPMRSVSLEVGTCCNSCRQATGRIVYTRANELVYKELVDVSEIKF